MRLGHGPVVGKDGVLGDGCGVSTDEEVGIGGKVLEQTLAASSGSGPSISEKEEPKAVNKKSSSRSNSSRSNNSCCSKSPSHANQAQAPRE